MKTPFMIPLIALITTLATSPANSAEDHKEATTKTQTMLRDKKSRSEVLKQDNKAQQADSQVDLITGGDNAAKEEMYDISAELMPWIVEKSGGDPEKMNAMLERALKNPQKFIEEMPATQRSRIKALSKKLEKSKSKP